MTNKTKPWTDTLLFWADIAGTLVFALAGASSAVAASFDLLGILVLSFSVGLGGGVFRDLLIGAVPPLAISDVRYPATTFAAGFFVFATHGIFTLPKDVLLVLDAAGLGLFAVSGAGKALSYGIRPPLAVLMGTIGAVGGGVVRDVLLARTPLLFQSDIYAVAAMLGASLMLVTQRFGLRRPWPPILGALACFALRMVAVSRGWNLPKTLF